MNVYSDLLTYRLEKMLRNHANHEAGDAISFCIVAVFSGHSRCTGRGSHSRRSRLDRIGLEFLPLQGANQNLSTFSSPESWGMLSGHEPGCGYKRSLPRLLPDSSDGARQ